MDLVVTPEAYSTWRDRALGHLAKDRPDVRRLLLWAERQSGAPEIICWGTGTRVSLIKRSKNEYGETHEANKRHQNAVPQRSAGNVKACMRGTREEPGKVAGATAGGPEAINRAEGCLMKRKTQQNW